MRIGEVAALMITGALAWLWMAERQRPNRRDIRCASPGMPLRLQDC
jgi:hypothetical protein